MQQKERFHLQSRSSYRLVSILLIQVYFVVLYTTEVIGQIAAMIAPGAIIQQSLILYRLQQHFKYLYSSQEENYKQY